VRLVPSTARGCRSITSAIIDCNQGSLIVRKWQNGLKAIVIDKRLAIPINDPADGAAPLLLQSLPTTWPSALAAPANPNRYPDVPDPESALIIDIRVTISRDHELTAIVFELGHGSLQVIVGGAESEFGNVVHRFLPKTKYVLGPLLPSSTGLPCHFRVYAEGQRRSTYHRRNRQHPIFGGSEEA
jgi:hypothetical protein